MKRIILFTLAIIAANLSWATGEVLKLDTKGIQYCDGIKSTFSPRNDTDLWINIDSPQSVTLYIDQDLTQGVFVLDMDSSMIAPNKASFNAIQTDINATMVMAGTFNLDEDGRIKSLNSNFILIINGELNDCHLQGSAKGKRINQTNTQ